MHRNYLYETDWVINTVSVLVCRIEETVMRSKVLGNVVLPCALSTVVEMEEGFQGYIPLPVRPHTHTPARTHTSCYTIL